MRNMFIGLALYAAAWTASVTGNVSGGEGTPLTFLAGLAVLVGSVYLIVSLVNHDKTSSSISTGGEGTIATPKSLSGIFAVTAVSAIAAILTGITLVGIGF